MSNIRTAHKQIRQLREGVLGPALICAILLAFLCISCASDPPIEEAVDQEIPKSIWVSLNNDTSAPISLNFQVGINDTIQQQFISSKSKDTLIISLSEERLLTIANKLTLKQDLIVSPGDSLFFHFNGEGIVLKSIPERQFVNVLKSQFPSDRSISQDSLYDLLVFTDSAQKMTASNDFSRTEIYPIFFQKDFYKANPEALKQFSDVTYTEIESITNKLNLEGNPEEAFSLSLMEEFELKRHYLRLSFLARRVGDKSYLRELLESSLFEEDFILNSRYGKTYLYFYITEGILLGEKTRTSNKLYIDYPKAYDLLDQHFKGALLAKAKWFCLEKMVDSNESYETISAYATDYQNTFPEDTLFTQRFQEDFLINREALVQSSIGVNLLQEDGSTNMLTGLLNKLEGKVIYVDYWASWCAPCRQAMPSSELLRDRFKEDDVAFVYFSIDNKQDAWRRASVSDGLRGYIHNYLVLNHEKSEMKKNLGMDAIPRYLIFDKKGRLAEPNAPGPMNASLESVLMKYIGQ
ncbi:TlpA disulfide reductase family protein [Roseivirga sp. E12]|uniref:TlpA family protein disulfide reductase n=1 Tax=Roseivirga sp. E12 TaxID=2819237 RepID=UPI001ABCE9BE|nr:TlpA disulfide reductase family protein [Roseivirga sp. E12]MBO3698896.1 TlpA family protein disulfide reductase [Roseivirga sp. E12]